jgi:hypothetical protein
MGSRLVNGLALVSALWCGGHATLPAQQQAPLGLSADPAALRTGIKPLDAERLAQALAAGEIGADGAYVPYDMRAADYGRAQAPGTVPRADSATLFEALKRRPPFYFSIRSPYSTAAALAKEAMENYDPRPEVTADELNSMEVVVFVGPADDFTKTDSIASVTIKRGDEVIQPLYTELVTVHVPISPEQTRPVEQGDFAFPFSVFEPTSDITLVMVGKTGTFEWTITREELSRMK